MNAVVQVCNPVIVYKCDLLLHEATSQFCRFLLCDLFNCFCCSASLTCISNYHHFMSYVLISILEKCDLGLICPDSGFLLIVCNCKEYFQPFPMTRLPLDFIFLQASLLHQTLVVYPRHFMVHSQHLSFAPGIHLWSVSVISPVYWTCLLNLPTEMITPPFSAFLHGINPP